MKDRNYLSSFAIPVIIAFALIFSGCGSTDSDSEEEPGNGNGNGNNQVSFSSGNIAPGETYSYTFTQEGEIEYYCEIHAPDMQGVIIVTSDAEAAESDTVTMENDQFNPEELTVAPNTEVVWVNNQSHDHDIRSGNPSSSGGGNPNY